MGDRLPYEADEYWRDIKVGSVDEGFARFVVGVRDRLEHLILNSDMNLENREYFEGKLTELTDERGGDYSLVLWLAYQEHIQLDNNWKHLYGLQTAEQEERIVPSDESTG